MNCRDLTPAFRKYRADARLALPSQDDEERDDDTTALLGGRDLEMGSMGGAYAPSWVLKSERARAEFGLLKDRLQKLRGAHTKALMVTFNTDDNSEAHVEILTTDIQGTFRKLDNDIRNMVSKSGGREDEDIEVQQSVQKQLAQALFKLSIEFRKEQTGYLNKVEAQKGISSSSAGFLGEDEDGQSFDPGFSQQQLSIVEDSQGAAMERDHQIGSIVDTIAEMAAIMRDLSTLIVEQGTMLDRIDKKVEQVSMDVKGGLKQLEGAERVQKNTCGWICTVSLVALIVLMLVIVVLRHAFTLF